VRYRLITPPAKEIREQLQPGPEPAAPARAAPWWLLKPFLVLIGVILLILAILSLLRPLPAVKPVKQSIAVPPPAALPLPWPNYGQSAIGAKGFGVSATHGQQKAAPMASIAKLATALSVLKQKPLKPGQQGPKITIGDADIATYNDYVAQGGSVVPIASGEQISQYQALQALLIPSANNFADTLARWAFGSVSNYTNYTNDLLQDMGLKQTFIADASGLSPKTVGSAQDLIKLGAAAMDNPVITTIVKQPQVDLPVAGSVNNTNTLLGADGIIGLKTGNTDQAGGCFLFAANRTVQNRPITIVGAVMGAPDLTTVINDVRPLIQGSDGGFQTQTIVKAGQTVGSYKTPWGDSATAVAKNAVEIFTWKGIPAHMSLNLKPIKGAAPQGTQVGSITVTSANQTKTTPVILAQSIKAPSLSWRLFR